MGLKESIVPVEGIERTILLLRGQKVILDADLAARSGSISRSCGRSFACGLRLPPTQSPGQAGMLPLETARSHI